MLTVMIDAEKTMRVTMTTMFKFSDTQTNLRVIIRRGVCQVTRYTTFTIQLLQALIVNGRWQRSMVICWRMWIWRWRPVRRCGGRWWPSRGLLSLQGWWGSWESLPVLQHLQHFLDILIQSYRHNPEWGHTFLVVQTFFIYFQDYIVYPADHWNEIGCNGYQLIGGQ